jgi:hypothetical protein
MVLRLVLVQLHQLLYSYIIQLLCRVSVLYSAEATSLEEQWTQAPKSSGSYIVRRATSPWRTSNSVSILVCVSTYVTHVIFPWCARMSVHNPVQSYAVATIFSRYNVDEFPMRYPMKDGKDSFYAHSRSYVEVVPSYVRIPGTHVVPNCVCESVKV